MDAEAFLESVESSTTTELDRLASSKSLIALTDASLDRGPVLTVAAGRERAAAEAFEAWAETADEPARTTFEGVAARHRGNLQEILALEDSPDSPPASTEPMHASLPDNEDPIERAAALVARSLVDERITKQVVGFFVNEADRIAADQFRDVRESMNASRDAGLELLASICASDDDWDRAAATAEATIQAAYDNYVDVLEGMGVNPKPVC